MSCYRSLADTVGMGMQRLRGLPLALGLLLVCVTLVLLEIFPGAGQAAPLLEWDPRLDGLHVTYQPAPSCSSGCWRLVRAEFRDPAIGESDNTTNVYARVLDRGGVQLATVRWHLAYPTGDDAAWGKVAPEWSSIAMYGPGGCYRSQEGPGPYWAYAGDDQAVSDSVHGLGLPYCQHVNFRLVWQWVDGEPSPVPSPSRSPAVSVTATALPGDPTPPSGGQGGDLFVPLLLRQPAAIPSPTATPDMGLVDLIRNGGFEADEAWYFAFNGLATGGYTTVDARSGVRAARLGIERDGVVPSGIVYSSVSQTVTIPAGSESAELSLWVRLHTDDQQFPSGWVPDGNDVQQVLLLGEDRHLLAVLWSGNREGGGWEELRFDLSAFRGSAVVVYVNVRNDGDLLRSWLYLDDVALLVSG